MHRLNARAQVIPQAIFAQTLDIFGIAIEGHHAAGRSDKSGGTESKRSQVRAHVIHDIAGMDRRGDDILHAWFMFAAPEACFLGNTQTHPETAREAGLHLKPGHAAGQSASLDESLRVVEPGLRFRPIAKDRGEYSFFEDEIRAIES